MTDKWPKKGQRHPEGVHHILSASDNNTINK